MIPQPFWASDSLVLVDPWLILSTFLAIRRCGVTSTSACQDINFSLIGLHSSLQLRAQTTTSRPFLHSWPIKSQLLPNLHTLTHSQVSSCPDWLRLGRNRCLMRIVLLDRWDSPLSKALNLPVIYSSELCWCIIWTRKHLPLRLLVDCRAQADLTCQLFDATWIDVGTIKQPW